MSSAGFTFNMPRQDLYAYIDGADIECLADQLAIRFAEFVSGRRWNYGRAWVVNQKHEDSPHMKPCDLPLWELGLNLEIPDVGSEPERWFDDVEAVVSFLGTLHRETGRDFVIGVADAGTGATHEDMFYITSDKPDMKLLRKVFGVQQAV